MRLLTKHIETRFDTKLESAKSDFRKAEERLHTELNARNTEIEVLRNNVLAISGERRALVAKKRIEAAETTWALAQKHAEFSMAVNFMKSINFEAAIEESKNQKTKEFFSVLSKTSNIERVLNELKDRKLKAEQLFLSPTVWAYFSVYKTVTFDAAFKLKFLESGVGNKDLLRENVLSAMVIELMPMSKEGFEKFGDGYAYYLLDQISDGLLLHLRKMIDGDEDDAIDVKRAAKISALAGSAMAINTPDIPESLKTEGGLMA